MALAVAGCAAPRCDEGDHACWLTRLIVSENSASGNWSKGSFTLKKR